MTTKAFPAMNWGQTAVSSNVRRRFRLFCLVLVLGLPLLLQADQVLLQTGDCLNGQVLSLTTNAMLFQSDVLGRVSLPRDRVVHVVFGAAGLTNGVLPKTAMTRSSASATNALTDGDPGLATVLRQLRSQTNLIQQAQAGQLSAAGPEAQNKFQQLVGGLLSGRLSVADIRGEAKSAADQLREFKKDLGPDFGDALDSYLSILDNFVRETAPATPTGQTAPATPAKSDDAAARPEK